jgi:hypothetical protein
MGNRKNKEKSYNFVYFNTYVFRQQMERENVIALHSSKHSLSLTALT